MPPDPLNDTSARRKEAARHGPSPQAAGAAGSACRRDQTGGPSPRLDPLRLCARRSSPSPGRAELVPRPGRLDGIRVPPFSRLCGDIRGGLGQPNVASRSWSAMPDSPTAMRSANGSSAASTRRSAPFRDGFADWGATPAGGGDGRVKTRTAPRPNRAPVPLGSLPTTPQAAPAPRPTVRRSRKTLPRQRMNRPGGAHHRSAKMCIDLHCLLHTSGTAPEIRTPPDSSPRQPIRNPCFDKGDGALQSGL